MRRARINGVISGTGGGLTLTAGTQTLSGTNTYTGATTINGGTLALTGTGSIANSSGVNVASAASTFDISGTTAGASHRDAVGRCQQQCGARRPDADPVECGRARINGVISGIGGGLTLTAGTQTLTGHQHLYRRDHDQRRHAGADRHRQHRQFERRERRQCGRHLRHFRYRRRRHHHDAVGRCQQQVVLGGRTLTLSNAASTYTASSAAPAAD